MISTPPPHLRCALQSFKLHPALTRQYHATTTPFLPSNPHRPLLHRPSPPTTLRFASDTTTHPASTHPSASSPSASNPASVPPRKPSPSPPSTLTWNTYLSLRRSRRTYSFLSSLLTCAGTTASAFYLISQHYDAMGATLHSISGVDPIFMLALSAVAAGGAGWLLGPFVGEAAFRVVYRREWGRMAAKEKDFYARIRRHRVDPSLASYSNPLPDYYGEKIGSVQEFRTWMRDQRAYNRKRTSV
ncbi:MAG: hypothetical protein LQ344_005875 [Seirophora lacunosa]|nr:MAG: hypothetical protein LQ344_005875 [Seirophora lacunosa]